MMAILITLQAFQAIQTWKHSRKQIIRILSFFIPTSFLKNIVAFLETFCFFKFSQNKNQNLSQDDLENWLDRLFNNRFSHFQTFEVFGQSLPFFFSFKFPNFSSHHTGYCPPNTGYCPKPTLCHCPHMDPPLRGCWSSLLCQKHRRQKKFLCNKKLKNYIFLCLFLLQN